MIGKKIAKRRIELGLSQAELADKAHMERGQLSRLEAGIVKTVRTKTMKNLFPPFFY